MSCSPEVLIASAMEELTRLCALHDTFYSVNKAIKQDMMNEKVKSIAKILEQIDQEAPSGTACTSVAATDSTKSSAKIAYILGKANNCFDAYSSDAELYLRRAVKLNPNDVDAWNTLGECCWKKGCYDEAKDCFVASNKICANVDAYCNLSMLIKLMKNNSSNSNSSSNNDHSGGGEASSSASLTELLIDQSLAYAKEAIKVSIASSKAWYTCGNAHCAKFFSVTLDVSDIAKALQCYQRAEGLTGGARNPDLYYNRAVLCHYIQDFDGAAVAYKAARAIDPSFNAVPGLLAGMEEYIDHIRHLTNTTTPIGVAPVAAETTASTSGSGSGLKLLKKKKLDEYVQEIKAYIHNNTGAAALPSGPAAPAPAPAPVSGVGVGMVGFDFLLPGAINDGRTLCVKLLLAVSKKSGGGGGNSSSKSYSGSGGKNKSNSDSSNPESSYLAMDRHGKLGIISVYHVGSDVTLCDHHASNNVIATITSPYVRGSKQQLTLRSTACTGDGCIGSGSGKSSGDGDSDAATGNNAAAAVGTTAGQEQNRLPSDGVVMVQVFDLSTLLVNGRPVPRTKIATSKLKISTFDS